MTKNRAQKQATRTRMTQTGEKYMQASHRRRVETITAWNDENDNVVIYGTHDAEKAMAVFRAYYRECGFEPGDQEWYPEIDNLQFYAHMQHLWTRPKADEEPFDLFKDAAPGRIPFLLGGW